MKITFLGTGTSQGIPVIACACSVCLSQNPHDKRLRSSLLIELQDTNILIDIGPDFRQQMLRTKCASIDHILLTHEHNDHIIGADDLRAFLFKQKSDIPFYALERVILEFQKRFTYAFSEKRYPGAPSFDTKVVLPYEKFYLDGTEVIPLLVHHGHLPILGFMIKDFVYITDAKYINEQTISIIKNCKVLVINALRRSLHHAHLNLEEAISVINEIQPQKVYLTHISHKMGLYNDVLKELPENIYLSFDGLQIYL